MKSNTVIFTSADRTLAIGAGQMSRVDAVKVARMKAAAIRPDLLVGSVAASDAFFPFRDGLDAVAAAGATAVVQPGGSVQRPGSHCRRRRARARDGLHRAPALPALTTALNFVFVPARSTEPHPLARTHAIAASS